MRLILSLLDQASHECFGVLTGANDAFSRKVAVLPQLLGRAFNHTARGQRPCAGLFKPTAINYVA